MVVTVVLLSLAAACLLFEQNVEVLQTFELRIDQPAEAALQFSVQKDVDTNTGKIQKYANDINAYVIKKISLKVKDYEGNDPPFVSGTLEFAPSGSSEFTMLSAITGSQLKEMAENEEEGIIELPNSTVEEKLTQLLRMGSPVTFRLNGITDNNPVAATLIVSINSLMTVAM